jgi:hypothetical protein
MPVVAPEQTTPDRGLSDFAEADAKNVDRIVASLVSKLAQNKILQVRGPSRVAKRFPTIVALFLAGAAGIATWFFLGAWVFTPLQHYYWNEYLNTEMFQGPGAITAFSRSWLARAATGSRSILTWGQSQFMDLNSSLLSCRPKPVTQVRLTSQ